ncbi:MAG: hypothetical protein M1825_005288 [Sarcosagium campestre]|nr:MAG: hypothetical protein M1825_005288 [Sarcosagium campestre]
MSTPNGVSTPTASLRVSPILPTASSGKRKRDDDDEDGKASGNDEGDNKLALKHPRLQTNGVGPSSPKAIVDPAADDSRRRERFLKELRDLMVILRCHDTYPSILDQALSSSPKKLSADSADARSSADLNEAETLASRVDSNSYDSLPALLKDFDDAASRLLAVDDWHKIWTNGHLVGPQASEILQSARNLHLVAGFTAMRKLVCGYISDAPKQPLPTERWKQVDRSELVNGDATPTQKADSTNTRAALSLFAGTPHRPQYLFSSFQHPISVPLTHSPSAASKTPTPSVSVVPPLREDAFPAGVSITKTLPTNLAAATETKRVRALGEVFSSPANLPPLMPPKQSKLTTTRASTVNWYDPESDFVSRKSPVGHYYTQPLPAGKWLKYNAVPTLSSPDARRQRRERALSTGEAHSTLSREAIAAHNKVEEEALFRQCYSSFAPTHDDSGAIVPAELRSEYWWHTYGKYIDDSDIVIQDDEVEEAADEAAADLASLDEQAILSWTPEEVPSPFNGIETTGDKELDDILVEVSSMLETLVSFQRSRSVILPSAARPQASTRPSSLEAVGTADEPSTMETGLFDALKAQLSLLVSQVPPYAVAKLNGDQLAELNINTHIAMQSQEYYGSIDDDDPSQRQQRPGPLAASTPNARISSINGQYGAAHAQPARSMYGTPASQPRGMHLNQLYAQQALPGRSSTTGQARSATAYPPSYLGNRPAPGTATAVGSPYASAGYLIPQQQQQPSQAAGRAAQSPYRSTNSPQYLPPGVRTSNPLQQVQQQQGNRTIPSPYHQTNQARNYPAASPYAQQPGRSRSPQSTPTYGSAQTASPYASASGPAPASSSSSQPQQQQQQQSPRLSQGVGGASSSTLGASGFYTHLSPQEQAVILQRQRATLAAQHSNNAAVGGNAAVAAATTNASAAPATTVPAATAAATAVSTNQDAATRNNSISAASASSPLATTTTTTPPPPPPPKAASPVTAAAGGDITMINASETDNVKTKSVIV